MKHVICFFIFFAFGIASYSQQRWVQFFVDGLVSEQDCRHLETFLMTKEGLRNVRAESAHGNLLIFIDNSYSYSKQEIQSWIEEQGLYAWCYRTGISGIDPITRISRTSCEPLQEKK